MKIAFVYPHTVISVPDVRVSDALAIVNYEIARRLAKDHTVIVYPRRAWGQRPIESYERALFCRVSVGLDQAMSSLKILDRLGLTSPERPYRSTRLYYANYARKVARDIRVRQHQIVHIHSIANFIPVIRRFNADARIVLHMHDHSLSDFDATCIRARLKEAALVLACSDYVINGIRSRFPEFADRCHTLHNGVDQRFLEINSNPARSQTVLFVGRLSPEKGVHLLLEAFRNIADEYPQADLRLVGPPDFAPKQFVDPFDRDPIIKPIGHFYAKPQSYTDALWEQASALGHRVRFDGAVPNIDVASRYAHAGIFVFPSVWHEPFGMPIIEAMAAGLPVITTRGGAASEIVVEGETGFLVERGNARVLASAIGTLLRNPALRLRMGAAGRERVRCLFTWDRTVAQLLRLYDHALGRGPAAADSEPGATAASGARLRLRASRQRATSLQG